MTQASRTALARLSRVALVGLGLGWGVSALAQGFGFAPTVIEINSQKTLTSQTTFYNVGNTPAKFTVAVKAWRMENGQAILEDTRDLIVNPTQFTIPAGKQQVIRIGLKKKPGPDELTYRLVVQQQDVPGTMPQTEVPVAGTEQSIGINVAMAFSLPVYIAPPDAAAKIQYTASISQDDIDLKIVNSGNRHETYNNMTVERGGKTLNVSSFAVLRGAFKAVKLPGLGSAAGPLTLKFTNARGVSVSETIVFK